MCAFGRWATDAEPLPNAHKRVVSLTKSDQLPGKSASRSPLGCEAWSSSTLLFAEGTQNTPIV
jgi:hypothetical protein